MGLTQKLGTIPLAIQTDSSNNVGIGGAANASYKLAVTGASLFSSSVFLGSNANSADNSLLTIKQASTAYNNGIYLERGGERNGYFMYVGGALDALTFRRNYFGTQSDVMSLTRDGNVGIANTNPIYKLDVHNGSDFDIRLRDTSLGGTVGILFETANDFSGTSQAYIKGIGAGNSGVSQLIFGTAGGSGDTTATERMRITSGGLVGIANSGISAVRLAVSYGGGGSIAVGIGVQDVDNATNAQYMQFLNAATTAIGSISRNGGLNQINYNTSSDYRLKEDFKDFNGLEKVTAIKVYDHKWVGFEDRTTSVIAHELAEILPYAVTGEKDAVDENGNIKPQQVDYSKIVPVLVKAIQELSAKVTALENK